MNYAKIIQVIETVSLRGKGTTEDPIRNVIEYWAFNGDKLAENDPYDPEDKDQHVCPMGDNAARTMAHLNDLNEGPKLKKCPICMQAYDSAFNHLCSNLLP